MGAESSSAGRAELACELSRKGDLTVPRAVQIVVRLVVDEAADVGAGVALRPDDLTIRATHGQPDPRVLAAGDDDAEVALAVAPHPRKRTGGQGVLHALVDGIDELEREGEGVALAELGRAAPTMRARIPRGLALPLPVLPADPTAVLIFMTGQVHRIRRVVDPGGLQDALAAGAAAAARGAGAAGSVGVGIPPPAVADDHVRAGGAGLPLDGAGLTEARAVEAPARGAGARRGGSATATIPAVRARAALAAVPRPVILVVAGGGRETDGEQNGQLEGAHIFLTRFLHCWSAWPPRWRTTETTDTRETLVTDV